MVLDWFAWGLRQVVSLMTTVLAQLKLAQASGLDRLDAQILLLHALQKSTHDRVWLLSHDTDEITPAQQQRFLGLIQRRLAGEPVAYLVGSKAFFGLNLAVNAHVLVPRPDTECLVEWALACIETMATSDVLDLGTGSGAIGLAIKHNCSNAGVTLVDASQAALDVALGNAASLGLAGIGLRGLHSNWFEDVPATDRFDLIVSNPPYIADGDSHLAALVHEPLMALTSGTDGLDAIRRIVLDAPRYLKTGGWLLLEHGFDQAAAVRELLIQQGFANVESRLDLNEIERCSGGLWHE
jgi:release factor glutamine methyltransferase